MSDHFKRCVHEWPPISDDRGSSLFKPGMGVLFNESSTRTTTAAVIMTERCTRM
jgi:hypothetical protein